MEKAGSAANIAASGYFNMANKARVAAAALRELAKV
jgi:hypothetical protein